MYEEFKGMSEERARDFDRYKSSVQWNLRGIIAKEIKTLNYNSVLEVGCGNGIDAEKYDKGKYSGVDVSPVLIEAAKKCCPSYRFGVMDCRSMYFDDNSFDVVFAIGVLEGNPTINDARKILSEMLRVSKGYVYIGWYLKPRDLPTTITRTEDEFGFKAYQSWFNEKELIKGICNAPEIIQEDPKYGIWKLGAL